MHGVLSCGEAAAHCPQPADPNLRGYGKEDERGYGKEDEAARLMRPAGGYVWDRASREAHIASADRRRRTTSMRFPARQARSPETTGSRVGIAERIPLVISGPQDAVSATDVMSPPPATRARAGAKSSRAAHGATPPVRSRKNSSRASTARPQTKKATPTPAGKSLDRAQHALDQAAQTEKQLRASLKKHSKAVSAAKDDLDRRDRDLKAMKSQLKTAKKSRKRATRELSQVK